ncbi:ATP-binding protein [Mechercharimyces sp. CAU 1602]|uniref:sensor histidine kinase n=1 Tax=Mechercharimyces sp. CAU 1602 TaxID=2973933 RepID=UPI002162CCF2|nr:ATP-binding protein [Mechercharimyces sp. CAU 1602]MCS1352655.1 ATP-binding protein [Mechercharimyces sp. CAU 1602]
MSGNSIGEVIGTSQAELIWIFSALALGIGFLLFILWTARAGYVESFRISRKRSYLSVGIVLCIIVGFDLVAPLSEAWTIGLYLMIASLLMTTLTQPPYWFIGSLFYLSFWVMRGVENGFSESGPIFFMGSIALLAILLWTGGIIQRTRVQIQQMKVENQELLQTVNEAYRRLHDYIDELEDTSRRDYLTGLYNLSGFQEQVTRSLARCVSEQSYHVICFDLVDFQQVNVREGMDAGDELLVRLARQLKKDLPPYAQVARYDGDQFAIGIIGDETVLRHCLEKVENVIASMRTERTIINYCQGAATYPEEAKSASNLIRLAEKRLSIQQQRIRHQVEERRRHLEKLSAVGQLAAGLAHEIRNPLTSIRGFIQISAKESEEMRKWESIILPEIDRINDLLRQFLHLSDKKPAKFTWIELDSLIEDVVQLMTPKAFLMGHELVPQAPTHPLQMEADPEQLKQVMINLMQNALESLGDRGAVWIRWKELRDRISIRIEDNGNGIQPEYMSRIFDPFFTTKGDGTGMGLSICHRIVSEHGGHIHVTSQPGRGTTFNIHLPIRQSSRVQTDTNGASEMKGHDEMMLEASTME